MSADFSDMESLLKQNAGARAMLLNIPSDPQAFIQSYSASIYNLASKVQQQPRFEDLRGRPCERAGSIDGHGPLPLDLESRC